MSHRCVNSTLSAVIQEIEYVLEEYPPYPYQSAFSIPELRQKLIVHILSIVPNHYPTEGERRTWGGNPKVHHTSRLQERLRIEPVVRGSILHILRENADWVSRHLSKI